MFKFLVYIVILVALPAKCQREIRKEVRKLAKETIDSLTSDQPETIYGKVVKVPDGDTYHLLTDDKITIKVRMEGIDAPETGMPFSRKATDYLKALTKGQRIRLEKSGIDMYGRTLGFSYLEDGRELGAEMIRAGFAWHYKFYNDDEELANLEIEAREARRGLWADKNPQAPWDIQRTRRRNSTKDLFKETTDGDINRKNYD